MPVVSVEHSCGHVRPTKSTRPRNEQRQKYRIRARQDRAGHKELRKRLWLWFSSLGLLRLGGRTRSLSWQLSPSLRFLFSASFSDQFLPSVSQYSKGACSPQNHRSISCDSFGSTLSTTNPESQPPTTLLDFIAPGARPCQRSTTAVLSCAS